VRGGHARRCVLFHVHVSCSVLSVNLVTAGRIAALATAPLGRPLRLRRAGRTCAHVPCRHSSAGSAHCLQICGRQRMVQLKFLELMHECFEPVGMYSTAPNSLEQF